MIYFATGSDPTLLDALGERSDLGVITTLSGNPASSYPEGTLFVADNGCFSSRWEEGAWLRYLDRHAAARGSETLWAVCPDVVGDHVATVERWHHYAPMVRDRGFHPAFVLQNGCESIDDIPDDARGAVFIGGDTDYKLGPDPARIAAALPDSWIHMGRVNSMKRLLYAHSIGCHSADGTYVSFGPQVNLPKVCSWLDRVHQPRRP